MKNHASHGPLHPSKRKQSTDTKTLGHSGERNGSDFFNLNFGVLGAELSRSTSPPFPLRYCFKIPPRHVPTLYSDCHSGDKLIILSISVAGSIRSDLVKG